jgi:DNA uptake protein ComE-like DNA-binding protein
MSQHNVKQTSGSVLIGVLWCVALLAIVVIGALHSARIDLMVGKNHADRIKAHYLALAGVERAKALLYQDMMDRRQSGQNHTGTFYSDSDKFQFVDFGAGKFRVIRPGDNGGIACAIEDEESRLNINAASAEDLQKLDGLDAGVASSILQWRGAGNGGQDADYYASLRPPCRPRGGAFETVRELLMVRGVKREALLGTDVKQNGFLDPDSANGATRNRNPGWAPLLTVDSVTLNQSASGNNRVNVQSADESTLSGVQGITPTIAKAIVASRSRRQIDSLSDLLDVTSAPANSQSGNQGRSGRRQQQQEEQPSNSPKVISQDLLLQIADELTTTDDSEQTGLININTASEDVLKCLPQMTPELAKAVVNYRTSSGFYANIAQLLQAPGMTRDIFKALSRRVTARSETFRIIGEGVVASTGARQRILVVAHIAPNDIQTLEYREDL